MRQGNLQNIGHWGYNLQMPLGNGWDSAAKHLEETCWNSIELWSRDVSNAPELQRRGALPGAERRAAKATLHFACTFNRQFIVLSIVVGRENRISVVQSLTTPRKSNAWLPLRATCTACATRQKPCDNSLLQKGYLTPNAETNWPC